MDTTIREETVASIDEQFVEYIVKSLVNKPDAVSIDRTIDEKGVLLKLSVDPEDLGRVIGKRGSTAQSIRTLLRALGTKNDARYNLKIMDPEGDNRPRPAPPGDGSAQSDEPAAAADEPAETDDTTPAQPAKPDKKSKAKAEPITEEAPAEPQVEETPAEEPEPETKDSLAEKTRKELAELDDLDI